MNREHFPQHKTIVVKIGTTSLTYPNGTLNLKRIQKLSWVLADLRNQGKNVVLVSSGSIAVGACRLGLNERPRDIAGKQAASAVGQGVLMQIYENFFMEYNQLVAQVLLTKDVIDDSTRKQYAKTTLKALLDMGVIPVVNENDTVAVDEIIFGDNDTMSAYVAELVDGDVLIILSDVDGLYDADPGVKQDASLIHYIDAISDDIISAGGESRSAFGTGGMSSKLIAAQIAAKAGIDTVIASGEQPEVLFDILEGKDVGTLINGKTWKENEHGNS